MALYEPYTQYSDTDEDNTSRKVAPISTNLGNFSSADSKTYFAEVNGERVELVKKSYVEKIENEMIKTQRDVKNSQTRIGQLLRAINHLTSEVNILRHQLNARQRFD